MNNNINKLKTFTDGEYIFFDEGNFDNYCVYISYKGKKVPPKDEDYFTAISLLENKYKKMVYNDFVDIYNRTEKELDLNILNNVIDNLSKKYEDIALRMNKIFSILYLGMIAEENKAYTVLGKKIKRLGMHMLLIENTSPEKAANYSRGKSAKDLMELCSKYGF